MSISLEQLASPHAPGAVAEAAGGRIRVAFAIGADGEPDRFCYFVETTPNRWALFDIEDLGRRLGISLPAQLWHSYFAAAPLARLAAVADFLAITGRFHVDRSRQAAARMVWTKLEDIGA